MADYGLATCSYSEFKPEMGVPVQASLGTPKWRLGYRLDERAAMWEVTPRYFYLRKPRDIYEGAFLLQLDRYGPKRIQDKMDRIRELFGGPLVVLCFENFQKKPEAWCHRTMFAQWWERTTGETVPELGAQHAEVEPPPTLFD